MENTKEKMLTVKDIQATFKCGKNQAYEIIHANGFPSIRIGRRLYVREQAFTAWLEKNQGKVILK